MTRLIVLARNSSVRQINIAGPSTTIGRAVGNRVCIDSDKVSRQHALIEWTGDRYLLADLGSRNGTWVFAERAFRLTDGDGSVRDTLHLSPGRNAVLGREQGDWVFPYDQTMSGRHAEIRSEDSEFVVHDLGSRNGVALSTRGERKLERGTRVLVGDQILRLESF